ncbi:MAG TPA: protein translocase subunit SecF [Candidatus Paceibacterota bacterium]|nr:protein translocase subunit SecF [Candidatus Paceibacterota bacterium]
MTIIRYRNILFTIAALLTAAAIAAIAYFGLPLSIEFTGGSLVEVAYEGERPDLEIVKEQVDAAGFTDTVIRASGENGILLKTHTLSPEEHTRLLIALDMGAGTSTELRFNSIGPSLGAELMNKAFWALGAVILAIVLYIAWAFRKVSRPVSSWVYGATVILILFHDVLVSAGFYAVWAHFTGAQVDSLFVVAVLAILGYSVNDTIVIFDRVRENLKRNDELNVAEPFEEVVDRSVRETITRSINTSVTTSLALVALLIVGSPATFNFALVLLVGVIVGTYSSILVAAPLIVPLAKAFALKPKKD